MNAKLEKKLFDKYNFIHSKGIMQDAMYFGCQHGDGWYKILDKLFGKIEKYFKLHPEDYKIHYDVEITECFRITTIKEKYSTLRVYTTWCVDEIDKWITEAEDASEYTCEECGKVCKEKTAYRQVSDQAWMYNMCKECWNKHLKKVKKDA